MRHGKVSSRMHVPVNVSLNWQVFRLLIDTICSLTSLFSLLHTLSGDLRHFHRNLSLNQ